LSSHIILKKLDVEDPKWKKRSCGIAALKMAMACLRRQGTLKGNHDSLDPLIKEGLKKNAYLPGVGWVHFGLVRIAKSHGFNESFRKEWKENKKEDAIKFLVRNLKGGIPILVSVKSRTGGHLVLLTGFSAKGGPASGGKTNGKKELLGFYFHDPNSSSRSRGKHKFISKKKFLDVWRGRVVVVI